MRVRRGQGGGTVWEMTGPAVPLLSGYAARERRGMKGVWKPTPVPDANPLQPTPRRQLLVQKDLIAASTLHRTAKYNWKCMATLGQGKGGKRRGRQVRCGLLRTGWRFLGALATG